MNVPRHGPRIVLRRLAVEDLCEFQAYRTAELGQYQGWLPQSDADASSFLESMHTVPLFEPGVWFQLGIADAETNLLIGDIGLCLSEDGLSAEIGFSLRSESHGQGLGVESVHETLSFIFEQTRAGRVLAITDARNAPAIRLLERLGMKREQSVDTIFRGAPCVEHQYVIQRLTE